MLLASVAPAGAFGAQVPPPSAEGVCPAIERGYLFCAEDLQSPSCEGFVEAAEQLAALYRAELRKRPGWESSLKTTVWWGCGSARLADIELLLERIGSPRARAVLLAEPYPSVPLPQAQEVPLAPASPPDCNAPESQAARTECAARELAAAQAAHRDAMAACTQTVAPALRGELVAAEKAWQVSRGPQCEVAAASYTNEDQSAFVRSRCLAKATRERTTAVLAAHAECAGAASAR